MRETMATSTSSLPASLFDAHDLMDEGSPHHPTWTLLFWDPNIESFVEGPSQLGAFAVLPHEVLLIVRLALLPEGNFRSTQLSARFAHVPLPSLPFAGQALSYIQPKDLLTSVSLVSKSFRSFALDDHLWRVPCLSPLPRHGS